MKLIWKIHRENVSISQLAGFVAANIVGLFIVILGLQLYFDIAPALDEKTGLLKHDYLVISKPVSTMGSAMGLRPSFSDDEIEDLLAQEFVKQVGAFTAARYQVTAELDIPQLDMYFSTEMFFESVPECFVDVTTEDWTFQPGDKTVPVIIPQDYINLYNFGLAQSINSPAINLEMIRKIRFDFVLTGNGLCETLKGRVVGLSTRLNTILVPESFMKWSNDCLSDRKQSEPSRIIVQVDNPVDKRIAEYIDRHDYVVEKDKLDGSRINWLLNMLISIVMIIGLIICLLACSVLVLSVFLLLQKNRQYLQDLLLLGYNGLCVALPYYALVGAVNLVSVLLSLFFLWLSRHFYLSYLALIVPSIETDSMTAAWLFSIVFSLITTIVDILIIKRQIRKIAL